MDSETLLAKLEAAEYTPQPYNTLARHGLVVALKLDDLAAVFQLGQNLSGHRAPEFKIMRGDGWSHVIAYWPDMPWPSSAPNEGHVIVPVSEQTLREVAAWSGVPFDHDLPRQFPEFTS